MLKPSASRIAAWRGLLTVHTRVVSQIEQRLATAGLPPLGWYDVLFALFEQPARQLRMAELAEKVLLSRSGLTRLVDRLEAEKYLQREACATDKRGLHVKLTAAGLSALRRIWPVYQAGIADLFAKHLSEKEVDLLNEVFGKISSLGGE